MKKCVIIGSGLGGLSCGCILAKNGYEVTVLEQGLQAGGCLQCFRRGDAVFDTGMHYIGSADRGQVLHKICTIWVLVMISDWKDLIRPDMMSFRFGENNIC